MARGTEAEQRLIAWAKRAFGEHLTSFLLSGLGEREVMRCRIFLIKPQDSWSTEEVRIKIVSDSPEGLPRGKHPLVLLALLKLCLSKGQETFGLLAYRYEDVYEALGWSGSKRLQAVIDGAVLRYFGLNYAPMRDSDAGNSDSGLADSPRYRLVSGYRAADENECSCKSLRYIYRDISFGSHVLEELKSRSLFGIDWKRIRAFKALPPEQKRARDSV